MNRFWNVLFWSVLSAAFVGPGTVTTASTAGARFGPSLLWALTFSTFACIVLQEGAARLTAVSGRTLGAAVAERFGRGWAVAMVATVVLGCGAYEAGNILGGVAGLEMVTPIGTRGGAMLLGAAAALLLATATTRWVARSLGLLVAAMGVVFVITAIRVAPAPADLLAAAFRPQVPAGSLGLVVGLIGTTVVPYNLFLGSGLAQGRAMAGLRPGIALSIGLGGLVSMAVLVVGTAVEGELDFPRLAAVLEQRLGAGPVVGFGLLAAGLSSAITAPLAAALTVESAFPSMRGRRSWVWGGVLAIGLGFGLSGVRPIPIILAAQLLNGLLLPLVVAFLLLTLNDPATMPSHRNGRFANALGALVWLVGMTLGVSSVWRGLASALDVDPPAPARILLVGAALSVLAAIPLVRAARVQGSRAVGR